MKKASLFLAALFCASTLFFGGWAAQTLFLNGNCPDRDTACIGASSQAFSRHCDMAIVSLVLFVIAACLAWRKSPDSR